MAVSGACDVCKKRWIRRGLNSRFTPRDNGVTIDHSGFMFAATLWELWKARSAFVFRLQRTTLETICYKIRVLTSDLVTGFGNFKYKNPIARWTKPEKGWFKLNTDDGSSTFANQSVLPGSPPRVRTIRLSTFYMCIPSGYALGYVYGGLVGLNLNWRAAFWGEAILMLPFAILGFIMKPLRMKGFKNDELTEALTVHETAVSEVQGAFNPKDKALSSVYYKSTPLSKVDCFVNLPSSRFSVQVI
ncbi:hypothetical protein OROHE_019856 [Orobanche hederae]